MLRLCSTSKVRQEILRSFGIPFVVSDNGFDEEILEMTLKIESPKVFAYVAALGKYKSALECYGLEIPLLIADSVVSCNGILQRKAKNEAQAFAFLEAQSGKILSVISCAILHCEAFYYMDLSATHYELEYFGQSEIESYLQSGLWKGKAGAVMVEGFHKGFIKKQIGSTHNAMGLHIEALLPFLKDMR
ncbi:septum formation inhibitor Maf [Helicobacter turcicus]|uniref:Nucleoside triphosphate pyrophosphatase n=1 Tax=Helicobacter turcicus TaxID=2867412 RepID=A0ABS7JL83_9HELI|nr:septum formation inhibitor Maf [Helicobacter turcicus]MBX7490160.1 septum formation inhibitor Maf [Helicobacter turcicus]MBX7545018.1 septum formation inhibitor Maf [Helicobacter turcicus]